jgi:hypothetical protein
VLKTNALKKQTNHVENQDSVKVDLIVEWIELAYGRVQNLAGGGGGDDGDGDIMN